MLVQLEVLASQDSINISFDDSFLTNRNFNIVYSFSQSWVNPSSKIVNLLILIG